MVKFLKDIFAHLGRLQDHCVHTFSQVTLPSDRSRQALCLLLGANFGSERPHSSGCPAGAGEEKQEMERVQVALECSWALG